MGFLDDIVNDALEPVFGDILENTITITTTTETYNPTTGAESSVVTSQQVVTGTPPQEYSLREIDEVSVKRGDFKIFVRAADLSAVPSTGTDTVTLGGVVYRLLDVKPIYADEEAVMYELQCRK